MAEGDITFSDWYIPNQYGSGHFTNNSNVEASDDTYATASFTGAGDEEQLVILPYDFLFSAANWSLPAGAELRGIEIQVECKCSVANAAYFGSTGMVNTTGGSDISTPDAGVATYAHESVIETGTGSFDVTTSDVTYTIGGEGFLFGLLPSEVVTYYSGTDAGFAIGFYSKGTQTATISIDFIRVRFLYWTSSDIPTNVTSFTKPGSADTVADGTLAWTNPGNITADDTNFATYTGSVAFDDTDTLIGYNFGLSLPAGAVPTGIEARVLYQGASFGAPSPIIASAELVLDSGGSPTPTGNENLTQAWQNGAFGPESLVSIGGHDNLWGEVSLTKAQVEHTNFGVAFKFQEPNTSGTGKVDYYEVRVFYEIAGGGGDGPGFKPLISPII